jgi:hypothetical protein
MLIKKYPCYQLTQIGKLKGSRVVVLNRAIKLKKIKIIIFNKKKRFKQFVRLNYRKYGKK